MPTATSTPPLKGGGGPHLYLTPISVDVKKKTAVFQASDGTPVYVVPAKDGGVHIDFICQGRRSRAHVRPNGAVSFSLGRMAGKVPLTARFQANNFQSLNTKGTQTFKLYGKSDGHSFGLRRRGSANDKTTRLKMLRNLARPLDDAATGATVVTISSISSASTATATPVPTPTLPTIATVSSAPRNSPPPNDPTAQPQPSSPSGGGNPSPTPTPNWQACLTEAVHQWADDVLGGAATVGMGAVVAQLVNNIWKAAVAAGTVDAAVILAASLGSGTAVLFIVGGIFVAGVAAYAIYQQYKSCMAGNG
ncbi:MAG: hypothetical protein WBG27_05770 [Candidatus Aquilonibacter sp.]